MGPPGPPGPTGVGTNGNDPRLSDDRVSSGLRTATGVVSTAGLKLPYVAIDGTQDDLPGLASSLLSGASSGRSITIAAGNAIQLKSPPNTSDTSGTSAIPNSTPNIFSNQQLSVSPGSNIRFNMHYRFGLYGCAELNPGSTLASPPASLAANNNVIIVNPWSLTPHVGDVAWVEQYVGSTPEVSGCSYDIRGLGVATIGTTDVTASALYGGAGTLNGLTLVLNVDGAGAQTLTLSGTTNTASLSAFIAAIVAKWSTLIQVGIGGTSSNKLLISALTSLTIGSGTANTALGITAGTPTYVAVLLNRSIFWSHAIGDSVECSSIHPKDIQLDFTGANVTGFSNQLLEFTQSERVAVNGLNYRLTNDQIPYSGGTASVGFDVACRDCTLSNSTFEYPNNPYFVGSNALYCQSNDTTLVFNNRVRNARLQGYTFMDCYASMAIANATSDCVWGHVAQSFDDSSYGCYDMSFVACSDIGSAVGQWLWTAHRTKTLGFSSTKNSQYGLVVDRNSDANSFTCCSYTFVDTGVYIDAAATSSSFVQLNTDGDRIGMTIAGSCSVSQWRHHSSRNDSSALLAFVSGAGPNIFRDVDLVNTVAGNGIHIAATGTVVIDGGKIATCATGYCLLVETNANVRLTNLVLVGGLGINCSAGTVTVGPGCDLSGVTTPISISGSGKVVLQQTGGILAFSGNNRFLVLNECYNSTIEIASGTAATVMGIPGLPGLQFTVTNGNSSGMLIVSTAGSDPGVTVAAGKTAIVRVNSTNHAVRVTVDT